VALGIYAAVVRPSHICEIFVHGQAPVTSVAVGTKIYNISSMLSPEMDLYQDPVVLFNIGGRLLTFIFLHVERIYVRKLPSVYYIWCGSLRGRLLCTTANLVRKKNFQKKIII
jgi:hypothetical protein